MKNFLLNKSPAQPCHCIDMTRKLTMSKRFIHSKSKKGKDGPNSQDTLVNADADNAAAKYCKKSLNDVKTNPHEVDVDVNT